MSVQGSHRPIPGTFGRGVPPSEPQPIAAPTAPPGVRALVAWRMGDTRVWRFRDSDGLHLALENLTRYPTWDEVKVARYRLLPDEATFAMILPPRAEYVDRPDRPNIMELTRVETYSQLCRDLEDV